MAVFVIEINALALARNAPSPGKFENPMAQNLGSRLHNAIVPWHRVLGFSLRLSGDIWRNVVLLLTKGSVVPTFAWFGQNNGIDRSVIWNQHKLYYVPKIPPDTQVCLSRLANRSNHWFCFSTFEINPLLVAWSAHDFGAVDNKYHDSVCWSCRASEDAEQLMTVKPQVRQIICGC